MGVTDSKNAFSTRISLIGASPKYRLLEPMRNVPSGIRTNSIDSRPIVSNGISKPSVQKPQYSPRSDVVSRECMGERQDVSDNNDGAGSWSQLESASRRSVSISGPSGKNCFKALAKHGSSEAVLAKSVKHERNFIASISPRIWTALRFE